MKGPDELRKNDLQNERLYLKTLNNEKNSADRQIDRNNAIACISLQKVEENELYVKMSDRRGPRLKSRQ